jgi:hypothetical protein
VLYPAELRARTGLSAKARNLVAGGAMRKRAWRAKRR